VCCDMLASPATPPMAAVAAPMPVPAKTRTGRPAKSSDTNALGPPQPSYGTLIVTETSGRALDQNLFPSADKSSNTSYLPWSGGSTNPTAANAGASGTGIVQTGQADCRGVPSQATSLNLIWPAAGSYNLTAVPV